MEAFSLLKYWRGGGGSGSGGGGDGGGNGCRNVANTTIVTAVAHGSVDSNDDDDDGPFFDLEFAVPADEEDQENNENNGDECGNGGNEEEDDDDDKDENGESEGEGEFNFRVSSVSSTNDGVTNVNGSLSPSDDLFFKGKLVAIEPSSLSDSNSKLQFPVSFLKSATKFRVFMLGFKKSKSTVCEKVESASLAPKQRPEEEKETPPPPPPQKQEQQSKFFTVKFKVEEVPLVSLFTRDNSSRNSSTTSNKSQKPEEANPTVADEKQRFSKDVVQKYLKMVKPLYIRVSRRNGEKLKFSGQLMAQSPPPPPPATAVVTNNQNAAKTESVESESCQSQSQATTPTNSNHNVRTQKQVSLPLPAGLRVVCKHLGKSRSASSVASTAPSSTNLQSRRRDDSLLQQQDGIQGAILHCKRSFNASREPDLNSSLLLRSASDPSYDKPADLTRKSSEEEKETCVF
ncbi:hypothetical protein RJ641_035607 [Dillenia turbinata]|uniref:Membrane-associated kinase regulator 2 n=1 Tax=Dillenia turbinata TaxID=194707 RepID=A0AAN8VTH8_9MAGN